MATIRGFITATLTVLMLLAQAQPARADTGIPDPNWRPYAGEQTLDQQPRPDADRGEKPGVVKKTGKADKIIKRRRVEEVHKVDRLKSVKIERVSRSLAQNKRRVRTSRQV